MEYIDPDVVFARPATLTAPAVLPENKTGRLSPSTPPQHSPLPLPSPSTSAAIAAAAAGLAWLAYRRARKRQHAFDLEVDRLEEAAAQLWHPDPAAAGYPGPALRASDGSTADKREREAKRCLAVLEGLLEEGLNALRRLEGLVVDRAKASRRCPWDARGMNSGRLAELRRVLSEALAEAERATEEVRLMLEVERLLYALDNNSTNNNEYVVLPPKRDDEGGELPSERLCTRATLMIGTTVRAGDRQQQAAAAAATTTRCVFPLELKACCKALESREQKAVDELKRGLQKWDLNVVDRALGQLRVLELQELAENFEDQKENVRSKRWGLQETLRVSFCFCVECYPAL